MGKYRLRLPQLSNELFISDAGLETWLIFQKGMGLPQFAAFVLLNTEAGIQVLSEYYRKYIAIAIKHEVGIILESPTWRASSRWAQLLGYSDESLKQANGKAINLLLVLREEYETGSSSCVISGCIGPKGDGYVVSDKMPIDAAEQYHSVQIKTFSDTQVDLVTAFTLGYVQEAIGMVRAARKANLPIVIGFTLETDGNLPSGQSMEDAIYAVDEATDHYVSYYMINCAHPSHFQEKLKVAGPWSRRIHAVRANASSKSHTELDEAAELDDGDPLELAKQYGQLKSILPNLNVLGGCCGTDERHMEAICHAFMIKK